MPTTIARSPRRASRARRGERSQALVVVALLLFVFIGAIGLAIDLGLIFYTKAEVTRAVDAAALAGAAALPDQALARARVDEYLAMNGVDPATATVEFPPEEGGQPRKLVAVTATKTAPLLILQALGLSDVTVESYGLGEQAAVDVMLVLDVSGSMCDDYPGQSGGASCPSAPPYPPGQWLPMKYVKDAVNDVFVPAFNETYDQLSLVTYSTRASLRQELTQNFSLITTAVDEMWPGGYTNIGEGVQYGTNELQNFPPDGNARSDSVAVMVVLTDGQANRKPGSGSRPSDCVWKGYYWDCPSARLQARLMAQEACNFHIIVYTITFGQEALSIQQAKDLMRDIADMTDESQDCPTATQWDYPADGEWGDGETENYFEAPDGDELNQVFADIAKRIFTRLNR